MAGWLVVCDDFLLDPHDSNGIPSGSMDDIAKQIVRGYMGWRNNIALVSSEPADKVKHWAKTNGLAAFNDVQGDEDALLDYARFKRDHHGGVSMVLTGNPGRVRGLLLNGFRVLSLATPVYERDEHRPDYEASVKPWDAVAAQHTGDLELHEGDPRRAEDRDDVRFTT